MKILLRTPLSQLSGYGRDGIGLAMALLDRGHDVRLSTTYVQAPLPREVAYLLTQPLTPPFDLALHHVPPDLARLPESDAAAARYSVLWTMWGWNELPDETWVPDFAESTRLFDKVVVYDPDSAAAFEPYVEFDRLRTLLGGYTADDWSPLNEPSLRPERPFRFGMNGQLSVRKGPYLAYAAFNHLKETYGDDFDARLIMRSTIPIFPPSYDVIPDVEVQLAHSLPGELRDFYQSLDTLLAPSMAEAKHLPPMEALACGTPVILSDIPGHRTWATSDMVTYVPTEPKALLPHHIGGETDPVALAEAMWLHYTNPAEQRQKAERAARTLPAMLDWSKCLERLGLMIGVRL